MREYSPLTNADTRRLLDVLVDRSSSPAIYQQAMRDLGAQLGATIAPGLTASTVCVVCTVEDADFLASGVLQGLASAGLDADRVKLVCFWNERVRGFPGIGEQSFDIAPVTKQYRESVDLDGSAVVIVKSIISGACVVKTNLAMLIDHVTPSRVFVASPVMLKGAEQRLSSQFPEEVASRFEYCTFAIDDEQGADENVVPGIGGSVYERLGFENKNGYVPDIVKQRRQRFAAA